MEQIVKRLEKEIIATLVDWIQVPSISTNDAKPGAPFGEQSAKMLEKALKKAESLGFPVRNFDGYAGDVRMGPEGVDPIAILGHLDVVPVENNWSYEPFGNEIHDGKIYGRGAIDDKGPMVAALYAMAVIKELGIPLKREVRLILGCDEERGMSCVKHYAQVCDLPKVGFSPDASYPLINTEKARLVAVLRGDYCTTGLVVKEINVGQAENVIPGDASAIVYGGEKEAEKINLIAHALDMEVHAVSSGEGLLTVTSKGITGHAAYPWNTQNALGQLLIVLAKAGTEGVLKEIAEKIGIEYDGHSLEIQCSDQICGMLTLNMGILRYNQQDGLYATLDMRLPMLANIDAVYNNLCHSLQGGIRTERGSSHGAHHVPPESKLIKKLLQAYEEETGLKGECQSTGGGTYAGCMEEGVAFGASFPDEPDLAHQANEFIPIDTLLKNVRIIAKAIMLLQ